MKKISRVLLTCIVVVLGVGAVGYKYRDYIANPWTRDGQVRANVVQVATRVSGPIVDLPIVDNQFVKAGDLLFKIDPSTYQAQLDQAQANFDSTLDQLEALDKQVESAAANVAQYQSAITQVEAQVFSARAELLEVTRNLARFRTLLAEGDIAQARFEAVKRQFDVETANKNQADASLLQAQSALLGAESDLAAAKASRGAIGADNAQLRAVQAALEGAQLNLAFTEQRASVDGYVSNLSLRLGSQATANQPAMALVDANSFWIDAYFRESEVRQINPGDPAYVTLMSYSDLPIKARVASLAWGIAQDDGSAGTDLLANVDPTFQWIRLAQRIPVRISLDKVPEEVKLRVGTTASVLVVTGEGRNGAHSPPPAPAVLQ